MKIGKYTPSQIRKTIVASIGTGLLLVNSALAEFADFIPAEVSAAAAVVISAATAISVFLTKNAPIIDSADDL